MLVYSLIISAGLLLARIRIMGISLGVTWVLIAGMMASAYGLSVPVEVMHFLKDFGLVLFVYCICLQVGPGFFSSLKKTALHLNLLAISVIVLGTGIAFLFHYFFTHPITLMAGIMSGAVTNTPGLGAAQAAANELHLVTDGGSQMALAYALSYPFGIAGIILSLLLLKIILRVNLKDELEKYQKNNFIQAMKPLSVHYTLQNPALDGKPLRELFQFFQKPFVVSRVLHESSIFTPTPESILHLGDTLLIVAPKEQQDSLRVLIGSESELNIKADKESELVSKILVVTRPEVTHRRLGDLPEFQEHHFTFSRLSRAGIEFVPHGDLVLQLGDQLKVVGTREEVELAEKAIGNSMQKLEVPDIAPIFVGIVLGLLLGSIPFYFPTIPVPIKLGVAGGPLLVALFMSKMGGRLYLPAYTTRSANLMVRELGISLFLASVGLGCGEQLLHALGSSSTLTWVAMGLTITMAPLMMVGLIARIVFKKTYLEICGLLAGSNTDPPALAFAMEYTGSEAPSLVYATVYPMAMILRIICAEALVLFLH